MQQPNHSADREPMAKVDTAWLRMEKPTNLMMITGVMAMASTLDVDTLRNMLSERLLAYRRFRQRPLDLGSQAFWETDPDFDINWHVRRSALPRPRGRAELEELVSQLASTPLDATKPLWQFHLVDDYRGGSVLIMRLHHCYADGMAMVQVVLSLTDTTANASKLKDPHAARLRHSHEGVLDRLLGPAKAGMEQLSAIGERMGSQLHKLVANPFGAAHDLMEVSMASARESRAVMAELMHSLTLSDDPPTRLKQPLGVSKRVAWCSPLPLSEVKALSRALECTVNDLLLTAACGALRSYLLDQGEKIDGLSIRATVPVNLRPIEHARELCNQFGLVFLELPIGESNPVSRLIKVRDGMRELKSSRQAIVSYGLLSALGVGPGALQGPALDLLSRKATTVATNVPGPQQTLYLCGQAITEMMFWVPQTGGIGVGISILSYAGQIYFGLISDQRCIPQPRAVIEAFPHELEKLMLLALLDDWDSALTPAKAVRLMEGKQG